MPRKFAKNKKKYWKHLSQTAHNELLNQVEANKISAEASLFTINRSRIIKEPVLKGNKKSSKNVQIHSILTYTDDPSSAPRIKPLRNKPSTFEQNFDQQFVDDIWNDDTIQSNKVKKPPPSKYRVEKSLLPSIPVPHPGASYNPSFGQHQNLLASLVKDEEKKFKAEKKLTNQLDTFFPKVGEEPTEASYIAEMSAGIFDTEDVESTDEESEQTFHVLTKPVENKSKKGKKRIKDTTTNSIDEKRKKKFSNDLENIPKLVKQIKKSQKEISKRQLKKKELESMKLSADPRDQPFLLSNELPSSLRVLKPQTDLLVDHLTSLTSRRKLPKRLMKGKRQKAKYKFFEKKQ